MTRDGTAEPVSRDQILRHEPGQGNIHFPCSADHENIDKYTSQAGLAFDRPMVDSLCHRIVISFFFLQLQSASEFGAMGSTSFFGVFLL